MKQIFFVLFLLLTSSTYLFAQGKFRIELIAPSFIIDKLVISPPIIEKGFEEFYNYQLDTPESIIDFGKRFGFKQSAFQITVQKDNIPEGQFSYPIPLGKMGWTEAYVEADANRIIKVVIRHQAELRLKVTGVERHRDAHLSCRYTASYL